MPHAQDLFLVDALFKPRITLSLTSRKDTSMLLDQPVDDGQLEFQAHRDAGPDADLTMPPTAA